MSRQLSFLAVLGFIAATGCQKDDAAARPNADQVEMVPVEGENDKKKRLAAEPKPNRLTIPRDGGLWPWPVSKAHADAPTIDTHLTGIVKTKGGHSRVNVVAAAVNPSIGKAVVTMSGLDGKRPKGKTSWGEVCLCDLTSGRVTHQWETSKPLAPFDIHRDGQRFLMRLGYSGYDLDSQIVELWEVGKDNGVRRRTWRPYYASSTSSAAISLDTVSKVHLEEAKVKWAGFVGSYHVATVHGSVLKLWDVDTLQSVASIPGVVGLPAVSPDGGMLAYLTGDAVALLDPASLAVVSAKRLGALPPHPVLAFHPSGQRLAAIGTGRAIILELSTGQVWDAMLAELKNEPKGNWADLPAACGWAGDKHIFFNGDLYDLDMPVPVWHYSWSDWANVQGRSVWAVADHPRDNQTVLKKFTIPHPGMQAALHTMLLTSDVFDLRPRDRVSVDVSGLPQVKQENIRTTLERRLQNLGYEIEPSASVVFKASVDSPKPTKVTYGGKEYSYSQQPARLKAYRAGKEIWSTTGCHYPPMMIWYNSNDGLADSVRGYGGPDYAIFTDKPLPGVIRKIGATRGGALGSSSFRAYGIEEK